MARRVLRLAGHTLRPVIHDGSRTGLRIAKFFPVVATFSPIWTFSLRGGQRPAESLRSIQLHFLARLPGYTAAIQATLLTSARRVRTITRRRRELTWNDSVRSVTEPHADRLATNGWLVRVNGP